MDKSQLLSYRNTWIRLKEKTNNEKPFSVGKGRGSAYGEGIRGETGRMKTTKMHYIFSQNHQIIRINKMVIPE